MSPDTDTKSWPVRRAESYGGVAVRVVEGTPQVALIRPANAKKPDIWALPKGGKDPDESGEDAAVREVLEETGLEAEVVEKIDAITYWYVWAPEQVRYRKTVHFYLMRVIGGDETQHDDEVEEVRFFPLDVAAKRAAYGSEKTVLRKALNLTQAWAS